MVTQTLIETPSDTEREAGILGKLVREWPGPALMIDGDGRVIAASPRSGVMEGMSASFAVGLDANASSVRDSAGRVWTLSRPLAGLRIATGETRSSPDAESRFTAAVSHEIRTPLNGILGMAALLEEGELSPAQKEYALAIRRSGARLLDLLNNVLDYSRIEAGDVPLEYAPFSPSDLVQDVAELLAPRAHSAGLDLAAIVEPGLPGQLIGDAGRLRQILFNLAGNAIKFTETGGVLLVARTGPGGEGLSLAICDTGRGVPEEARTSLFDAFSQARADDSSRDGGVGLGLAIVAHLTRAMKGEIVVTSRPGYGSTFRVDLPLLAVKQASAVPPPQISTDTRLSLALPPASRMACLAAVSASGMHVVDSSADAKPGDAQVSIIDAAYPPAQISRIAKAVPTLVVLRPEDRSRIPQFREMGCAGYLIRPLRAHSILERVEVALKGEVVGADDDLEAQDTRPGQAGRVLIADDNAVNTLLASRALASAGYHVDTAGTGAEALERAGETPYDVIFMDIRMPVMDGLEATRRIRLLPGPAGRTPVVAITADINPELENKAQSAGVSQLASKPIDPPQLRDLAGVWTARRMRAAE